MAAPKLRFKEFDGDWLKSKIGDIFDVTSGSTPLRSDNRFFENATIPWVKTTDLNNSFIISTEEKISEIALKETSVKIVPKNTVFVAMYGGFNQIGRTGLLLNESACNQALSAIYPNENIDSFFLLTYLNHKVDDWKSFAASSRKDPNITKSDVLAFPMVYPSKKEQTKIASFLSAVDEKISQLTQKHQLLSQYKQGMMQKLFSQQLRFKAEDGSEFGEWEEKKLGEIASKVGSGSTPRGGAEAYVDDGIIFIRSQNVNHDQLLLEDIVFIPENTHQKMAGSKVIANDILLNITGASIGRSCVVPKNFTEGNVNQHVCIIRTPNDEPKFIQAFLSSKNGQDLIESYQTGSGREGLNFQSIRSFDLSMPCLEEQTKIANFLSAIDQKIEVVAQQIEQAKTWKKGLLQQMFV